MSEMPPSHEGCVTVDVSGLSVYTHHGVSEEERRIGQRLIFDVSFELEHCDAILTDRVEDTVDYSTVCDVVYSAATDRSYRTLERLSQAVVDCLFARFTGARSVTVRVAKPEPPLALPVSEVAVELVKERADIEDDDEAEIDAEEI